MYKIIKNKRLLIYKPEGVLTDTGIMDYINRVLQDADFKAGLLEFIDLSSVTEWQLTHSEVEKITFFDNVDMSPIKKIAKTGIYAPTDIAFGMARMYQTLAERYHSDIFISKDLEEATQYLGFSAKDIAALLG